MAKMGSGGDPSAAAPALQPAGEPGEERFDIRIARDGTWHHRGDPIRRMPLVRLFATVLRRDEAGAYWLATPFERGRIEVEGSPFTAVEVDMAGEGPEAVLTFRTNLDETVEAGADHPIRVECRADSAGPCPYIEVRPGLEARLLRPVFYALAERTVERDGRWGVWSRGEFFPLDPPADG